MAIDYTGLEAFRRLEPITRITPFTERAGDTYLKILEDLSKYVTELSKSVTELDEKLVDAVNLAIEEAVAAVAVAILELDVRVDDKLDAQNAAVASQLTAQNAAVASQLTAQNGNVSTQLAANLQAVNDAIATVINSSIELQDAVLTGILKDPSADLTHSFGQFLPPNSNDVRLIASMYYESRPVVGCGSSTMAGGVFFETFMAATSQAFRQSRMEVKGAPPWASGVSGYNYGYGGRTSANYLSGDDVDEIVALNPKMVMHAVGANDWRDNVAPHVMAANIRAKMVSLNGLNRLQVYVHQHARMDVNNSYEWSDYLAAVREATADLDYVVCIDLATAFEKAGIKRGGSNFLGLMSSDSVHLSNNGQYMLGELLAMSFGASALRAPGEHDYSSLVTLPGTVATVNALGNREGNLCQVEFEATGSFDVSSGTTELFTVGPNYRPARQVWGVAWGTAGYHGILTVRPNGAVAMLFEEGKTVTQLKGGVTWLNQNRAV